MVKLNIEMSMADMIVKLARGSEQDVIVNDSSSRGANAYNEPTQRSYHQHTFNGDRDDTHIGAKNTAVIGHNDVDEDLRADIKGIARQTEVQVYVGDSDSDSRSDDIEQCKRDSGEEIRRHRLSDGSQIPLSDLQRPVGLHHAS